MPGAEAGGVAGEESMGEGVCGDAGGVSVEVGVGAGVAEVVGRPATLAPGAMGRIFARMGGGVRGGGKEGG